MELWLNTALHSDSAQCGVIHGLLDDLHHLHTWREVVSRPVLQGAAQGAAGGLPSQWQLCRAAAQREACRQKHARPLRLHTGAIHAFGPCPSHVGGTLPACPCQASPWAGTAAPRRSLTKLNGWLAVPMAVAYFIVAGGVWFVSMMTKDNLKRVEGVHGAQPSTHVSTVAAARVQSDVEAARSEAAAYRQEREAAARRQLKLRLEAAELRALVAFEAATLGGGWHGAAADGCR